MLEGLFPNPPIALNGHGSLVPSFLPESSSGVFLACGQNRKCSGFLEWSILRKTGEIDNEIVHKLPQPARKQPAEAKKGFL
jgi:hypothetical protein